MAKIIAFSGQRDSGKNQSADFFLSAFPDWTGRAFADPVKDIFCKAFGVTREFVEKWKRVPIPPPGFEKTVRQSLVFIGDGFRKIRPKCWIERGLDGEQIALTDGRYWNEAIAVRERGGLNILVWRPGFENEDDNEGEQQTLRVIRQWVDNGATGPLNHSFDVSEECKYYDYLIRNDGDVESLEYQIRNGLVPFVMERLSQGI